MFAIPISMQRFKSINFYQNIPKLSYFCEKKSKIFCVLRGPPPNPRASSGWGLCPQTPILRQLGASPPGSQKGRSPLRNSGFGPGVFIAAILLVCALILRFAGVYVFSQAALFF